MKRICASDGTDAASIMVPRLGLPPSARPKSTTGPIDIGPFRGTEMAMTPSTVARITGVNRLRMPRLIAAGLFRLSDEREGYNTSYVTFDPGRTISSYLDEWIESQPILRTHAEFAQYRTIRRLCQIPAGSPHGDRVLEAVFQKLKEIGNFSLCEVRGLISVDQETFGVVAEWLGRRAGEYRRQRPIGDTTPITRQMFEASLPSEFTNLPRTCLDRAKPYAYEHPSHRVRQRVWALNRLFECGALYALVYTPKLRRPDGINPALVVIARIEEIMTAHSPTGSWDVGTFRAALHRYAFDPAFLPGDVGAVRDRTIRFWCIIVTRLHRYLRSHDRHGKRGLAGILPPLFKLDRSFRIELIKAFGTTRAEALERRKLDSNKAFAELDEILDAARNRRDQVRTFGNAMRAAATAQWPHVCYTDFPVDVPVLDERGRHMGGIQTETFRLWRLDAAWRSLVPDADDDSLKEELAKRDKRGYDNLTVVEYLHTVGRDGAAPRKSWMATMCENAAFSRPGFLAVDVRERRHEFIALNGLPGAQRTSGGTLMFGRERGCLASHAIGYGRIFVPLAEFERAIRFGYWALDVVAQSMRRSQEVRQLLRREWNRKDVVPGKVHFSQEVWPKIDPHKNLIEVEKVPVTVLAETVDEALDLCDLHVADCGFDRFPIMQPVDQLKWKCPPGEYILSHNGRALTRGDPNVFLRYLLAGWPSFTLHDFRYAGAEDAEFDDEPISAIQVGLGHQSPASTTKYRKLSKEAQAIKDERDEGRREDGVDARAERRRARGFQDEEEADHD